MNDSRFFIGIIALTGPLAATFVAPVAAEDSRTALPGQPTIAEAVELPCRDADGIAMGDLTGNGKLDIVASESKPGVVLWFEQGDDWTQWTKHTLYRIESGSKKIEGNALGDFDGDGHLEAITLEQPGGRIFLHQHDGDPHSEWRTSVIQANRPLLQDATVTDINDDGRVDLVYTWEGRAEGEGGVNWLTLAGDDPLEAEQWRDHVMTQYESAWWLGPRQADLSGDGEAVDIVFTARNLRGRNPGARPGLYWMQPGDDVTEPWRVHTIDDDLPHPLHVDMGDLSGEGHGLDLVVGGFNTQTIYWYAFGDDWKRHALAVPEIDGVQPNRVWNVKTLPMERGRDGIMAPAVRGNRGALFLFGFDEGEDRFEAHVLRELDYGHPMDDRILLHDITGDGQPELFIPDSGSGVNLLHILRLE